VIRDIQILQLSPFVTTFGSMWTRLLYL